MSAEQSKDIDIPVCLQLCSNCPLTDESSAAEFRYPNMEVVVDRRGVLVRATHEQVSLYGNNSQLAQELARTAFDCEGPRRVHVGIKERLGRITDAIIGPADAISDFNKKPLKHWCPSLRDLPEELFKQQS